MKSKKVGRLSPGSTTRIEGVVLVVAAARDGGGEEITAAVNKPNPKANLKFNFTP
jgi:hypothetical protein